MNKNDKLRQSVKLLKAIGQIDSYIEIAEMIGIKNKSMYNWLRGEYQLGTEKLMILEAIVSDLWIPIDNEL